MKLSTFTPLLLLFIIFGCLQQSDKKHDKRLSSKLAKLKNSLRIENKVNRGMAFDDSIGDKYAITYIPITVTNNSETPVKFQIEFLEVYNHPLAESDDTFELVILPKVWAMDGIPITDSLIKEIPKYTKKTLVK